MWHKDSKALLLATATALTGAGFVILLKKSTRNQKHQIPPELLKNAPYSERLKLAITVALETGKNIAKHSDTKGTSEERSEVELEIKDKGQAEDFATAIDIKNEKIISNAIYEAFPLDAIIGEESIGSGDIPPLTDDPTWIIDPIDGTTNFVSGLPLSCVSVGFCVNRKAVLGVVYAPMTDELYIGVRGHGSYRNGVQISTPVKVKKLRESIINYEFGYAREEAAIVKMTNAVKNILENGCRATRCLGSGVLDICYVATGRLDVVYAGVANEGWKPWDYCAANVIVEEAGGVMESLINQKPGHGFDLYSKSIVCATSKELLDETRKVVLTNL